MNGKIGKQKEMNSTWRQAFPFTLFHMIAEGIWVAKRFLQRFAYNLYTYTHTYTISSPGERKKCHTKRNRVHCRGEWDTQNTHTKNTFFADLQI